MTTLDLHLFGAPRVERNGAVVAFDTRKAVALLAYLAVTRRPHTREALAGLLWPDYDGEHARGALRRTLSTLKKAIGAEWLEADRGSIGLRGGPGLRVDVTRFRDAVTGEAVEEAAAIADGDFLAGFALRDSPEFDDWQSFEADSLRRELAGALERLVGSDSARGEHERAIAHARRWLALDPLHEPAHRELIRLYASTGGRARAVEQYRECVRVLSNELGVGPLRETTELYEQIDQGAPPPPEEERERPRPPGGSAELPLVGRSAELKALLDAYEHLPADGGLVVLAGEAGIGKTRLGNELLREGRSRGAHVASSRSYAGEEALAYGPIVDALRSRLPEPGQPSWLDDVEPESLAEAARLVPELGKLRPGLPDPAPLDAPGARARFLEAVGLVLSAALAGPAPGVLLVDDLHWADDATLDLLTYLVRRRRGRGFLLVVTWRDEEAASGERLRALAGEAQAVMALTRLTSGDVAELVGSASRLAERLYEETEGLPFFVAEYLAAGAGGDESELALASGARALIESRLAGLGELSSQVLAAAAVIGRSFELDTARAAAGRTEEETVLALEELTARALIREAGGPPPAYDFSHDKVRALVYEDTSLARRRLLHRRVAEALTGGAQVRPRPGSAAAVVARHLHLAGRDGEAAEWFEAAAQHATAVHANAEALAHLRSALAIGHPATARLHERCGDLLALLGRYGEAAESYETAAAGVHAAGRGAVERKLGGLNHRRGEWDLAERHFTAAAAAGGKAAERAQLHADWSLTALRRGDGDRALRLAREALALAEAAGEPGPLAQAHNTLGVLALSRGETVEARSRLERSLELAEPSEDPGARVAALNNLALTHREAGDGEQALRLTRQALELCAAQGDRHREGALHNNLADLLRADGRSEEAEAHVRQGAVILAEVGADEGLRQPEIWMLRQW